MGSRKHSLIWLSVIFLLAVLTHAETLQYWFVATDSLPLIETSRVGSLAGFEELFTQPLMSGSDFTDIARFYRPISSLSYALDYALWGSSATGYHLTNVLAHAIAAVLVALTVASVTARTGVGYLSAVLFAVHPLTVGVVPAISRRQDILLTIFLLVALLLFVRSRRENRPRLRWGALVAYALALGTKETAVLFPGLVFVWVAIHDETNRFWPTLMRAISKTIPFVAVTIPYLVVRTVALGGIGGYRAIAAPSPGASVIFVPVKYLLWVAQPANAVERALAALPRTVLLGCVVVAVVVGVSLLLRGQRGLERNQLLAAVGSVAGFGALFFVLAFDAPFDALVTVELAESGAVVSYLVGGLFVGGCLAGLSAAILARNRPFRTGDRRSLLFFIVWLLAVPGLLLVTGAGIGSPLQVGDQIQTGYLCLVPAMAGLSLVSRIAAESLRNRGQLDEIRPGANAALVAFVVVLVLPLLATSPLVQPYDEWERAGELNERTVTGLGAELDGVPADEPVYVIDPPVLESDDPPLASTVKRLKTYSVEAWFDLQDPPWSREIRLVGGQETKHPERLSFETTRTNESTVVRTTMVSPSAGNARYQQLPAGTIEYSWYCRSELLNTTVAKPTDRDRLVCKTVNGFLTDSIELSRTVSDSTAASHRWILLGQSQYHGRWRLMSQNTPPKSPGPQP